MAKIKKAMWISGFLTNCLEKTLNDRNFRK